MANPLEPTNSDERAPDAASVPVVARHKRRRTWPQRLLLTLNVVVILACFAGAIGLAVAGHYGNSLVRVDIETPTAAADPGTTLPATVSTGPGATAPVETGPPETFPAADPQAKNFLIT